MPSTPDRREAAGLADLVPPAGELSDEVWASPSEQDQDADLLDPADQDVTDADSDLDPDLGSGSGGDPWWADDSSVHPDPGSEPGPDPASPANPDDFGGWE